MTFAVCVTFQIKPDQFAAFMPLMLENAKTSMDAEPGCARFDVLANPDRPAEVFSYEVYNNAAAFQDHLASDHFKAFDQAVGDMIADKVVKIYTQVAP